MRWHLSNTTFPMKIELDIETNEAFPAGGTNPAD